ncbi:hypothetical protein mRhiFer1_008687 [Rhinolophus ferrumequinum]|uniref:Uncharacterized protein n=1 Tax=Rhinolophus ferrumequinum TaxID=59479 RepID=A0A7J7TQD0_RHIFE|nr:hypothetical protein mRhiFer1_008687 [Rhinolophus ferrumequinum]
MALTLGVSSLHIDLCNLCTCESLSGEEVSQSTLSELEDLFSKGPKDHTTDSRKEKGLVSAHAGRMGSVQDTNEKQALNTVCQPTLRLTGTTRCGGIILNLLRRIPHIQEPLCQAPHLCCSFGKN